MWPCESELAQRRENHLGGLTSVQVREYYEEQWWDRGRGRGGTTAPLLPYTRTRREHAQSGERKGMRNGQESDEESERSSVKNKKLEEKKNK